MHSSPPHALAWSVWAVAGAAAVQVAPNPLYVAAVVVAAALVWQAHALDSPVARAFPVLVGVGAAFVAVRVVLAALTTHGVADAWFTLPSVTLPRLAGGLTLGGSVEGQVVAQAAADGFALVGVLAVFGAFNAVVSHHELVASAPRAFHEPGLVLTVALAFVPSTIAAIAAAREADRARTGGRAVRRGRIVRMAVPVLESGLERAVALSESLDARGFGRQPPGPGERAAGWSALVAVLALGGALVAAVGQAHTAALGAAAMAVVALGVSAALASGAQRRTRYRRRRVGRGDVAVMALALAAPAGLALARLAGDDTLTWSADRGAPAATPVALLAAALLAAPAVGRALAREGRP